jgi:two-component system phosphate regulon sensor histidine kinase PhoR
MARLSLTWRLIPAFIVIALVSLAAAAWHTAQAWRTFYLEQLAGDLTQRARLAGASLRELLARSDGDAIQARCREWGRLTATRFTVILPTGQVVGDSQEDPARLDNHGDRPEIQAALTGKVGLNTRHSFTLGETLMYVAVPVPETGQAAGVVRASLPMSAISQAIRTLYVQVALGGLILALLAAGLSYLIARRLTGPLADLQRGALRFARGELGRSLPIPATDELASLAEALNHMAAQLQGKIENLTRQGQEQQAIFASMSEGVLALDDKGRLLTINQAGSRMLKISAAEALGRPLQDFIRDPGFKWFLTRTLASAEPVEGEVQLTGNGRRLLTARGTSLRDARGGALGTLIVLHDITQLRQLENTRRDFVANVSHELKTPITSIKGFVETLLAGALKEPDNAGNFLRIIAKQTERLNEIIDDLLSLSRLEQEAERGQIFLTGQKLKGVLESAVHVCRPKADAKKIDIAVACPETLRGLINAPLLEQALVNLIDNAVKFSEPGGRVQVEAEGRGAEVAVRVRDQGAGIPAEHLPRIFERFYRVDAGRSRKVGGSGLGLAIVKHIALAHGGRVTVESAPGQGTIFTLVVKSD